MSDHEDVARCERCALPADDEESRLCFACLQNGAKMTARAEERRTGYFVRRQGAAGVVVQIVGGREHPQPIAKCPLVGDAKLIAQFYNEREGTLIKDVLLDEVRR